MSEQAKVGETWRYRQNRGSGSFSVVRVDGDRVTLRNVMGKDKSVSLRTLRGDYELVERGGS